MTIHKVQVGTKKKKSDMKLPEGILGVIQNLDLQEKKAYLKALRDEGWTLQSMADVIGVTRERIRQLVNEPIANDPVIREKVLGKYRVPQVPSIPIYDRKMLEVEPEVLAQLIELRNKAQLVRSTSTNYREEAELFTKLAWEQVQKGVSCYSLAKSLGVTTSALESRFVRYGYKTSEGKSKVYKKISYLEKRETNEQ